MLTLKSVKLLCHRFLRGAPQTLRLRYRPPSSFPKPSSVPSPSFVLHPRLRNCSPFSFSALFTGFVSGTVLRPVSGTVLHSRFQLCSPESSPLPSSILVSGTVLHSRFQPCSPDSSPEPFSVPSPELFSILVFSPVHRIRLRYRPPSLSPEPSSVLVFSRPVFLM